MLAAAALLIAAAAETHAGLYETHQMEMAGALELQPSGRFRYVFDYGAVSEASEGRWKEWRGTIRLTAIPRPIDADPERSWAAFRSEPLTLDGTRLVMHRFDAEIRFLRVRP